MLQLLPAQREARWHDQPLALSGTVFDLLRLLARCPGEPTPSTHLLRALWPGRRVDPANLRVQVAALRRHLGPDAVRTVPGRGYMLTVPVTPEPPDVDSGAPRLAGPLPVHPDVLIGREACLQQLEWLIQQHRLVSVVGPGGIGKTRVAQHLAQRLRGQGLSGGLLWVDLASRTADSATVAQLCRAAAEAGGLQWLSEGDDDPANRLGLLIHLATGAQAALLVLDNAEHLSAALAALLPGLLAAAPALRVLVTSQHAPPAPFGHLLWLQPLAVPAADASAADTGASPAVRLLLRRAQAVHPQWQPSAADWPAIAALVRALDGLPLALELAAARLPMLGAAALHERLAQRLQTLGDEGSAASPRHRSLVAALDWGFALLPPHEQQALCQLAVFATPFRLHPAVRLLHIPGLDDAGLESAIQGLVAHSMLQLLPASPHGAPVRLRMAETTRLYALQRQRAQGPAAVAACEQRHSVVMAALARQACAEFLGAADAEWSSHWLPDHEDLQRAFDAAHARGDAEVAADIIEALVLGANITGRTQPALQRWAATRELAEHAAPAARAKLLGWGNLAQVPGTTRLQQSAQRLQAWRLVPGEDGRRGLCVALAMHAVACQDSGDPGAADTALAECQALESPAWPARLRRRCGWVALTRLAIARDDDALLAGAGRLSVRLAAELQQQGAWREHTLVQGQQALMLRLRGQPGAAAALLAKAAHTQLQLGCGLDAGRSLGLQCAALAELPPQAPAAGAPSGPGAWPEARPLATRALELLVPFPAQILYFAEALADWAARRNEPELAVYLLAGAAHMRHIQQSGRDRLTDRAAERAWQQLRPLLDAATLERCVRHGRELSADALRTLALRWLVTAEDEPPGGSPAALQR